MPFLTTALDVAERMSQRGLSLRLDDQPGAITQCLARATNKVMMKLLPVYRQEDLVNDALFGGMNGTGGMTKDLCTDAAVCEVARRRGNAVASTWKDICKDNQETLQQLHDMQEFLPGVNTGCVQYPATSNLHYDPSYVFRRLRVETQISDQPPTSPGYAQAQDWFGLLWVEF